MKSQRRSAVVRLRRLALTCAALSAGPTAAMVSNQAAPQSAPVSNPQRSLDYLVGAWDIVATTPGTGESGRLVLEGDARSAGGVVRVRETIERVSDNEFVATWEAYRDGAWSAYSIERVTRRAESAGRS